MLAVVAAMLVAHGEKDKDPLSSVESAVDHLIEILDKRDYDTFFDKCVIPEDRERVLTKVSKKDVLRHLEEKGGPDLLRGLKEVKGKAPMYEKGVGKYSARANLEPKTRVGESKYIRFFKLDGRWYYSLF